MGDPGIAGAHRTDNEFYPPLLPGEKHKKNALKILSLTSKNLLTGHTKM